MPAITTSGVMNVVSTISGIEMPSTPRWYQALKAPIHGSLLDELHRRGRRVEVAPEDDAHGEGRERSRRARASGRTRRCGRPTSNSNTPAAIGSQMSTLRIGQSACMLLFSVRQQQPPEQRRQADDHRERVVIEVAGSAGRGRTPATQPTSRAEPLTAAPSISATSPPRQNACAEPAAAARQARSR